MDGPVVGTGAAGLLRNSGVLLAARAVQTLFGAASFVVLTRRLGPEGFGEVVTVFGFASVVGGVLGAALSDAAVLSGAQLPRLGKVAVTVALASVVATGSTWAVSGGDGDAVFAALGSALFVSASAASAARTARARAAGEAAGLALLQVAGAFATLATVAVLAASGVRSWGPYVVAYAVQPAALLLLRPPDPAGDAPGTVGQALRRIVRLSGPFVVSQAVWPMLGLTNIVVLRALSGPGAVGRYGAMVRILDLVGVAGPLLGMFALPAFARLQKERTAAGPSPEVARLNLTIAAVSTLPVVAGMHLAWAAWEVAYPDLRFPTAAFALLAAAYGLSSASGLPDRILQSAGGAGIVARAACAALAGLVVASPLLVSFKSLTGAGVALLVAVGGVNLAMLAWTRPSREAIRGHAWIVAVVAGSAALVASGWALGSVVRSVCLVAATASLLVLGVLAVERRLRPALRPS